MADEKRDPNCPQLNMEHGFMHSIIRNQIDRDEFDKEQKRLKMQKQKESLNSDKKKRERRAPLHQVYVPPHQRKSISPEKEPKQELLLRLEFEGKEGGLNHLDIYKDDDIKRSVRIFAAKCHLDNRLRDALYKRISDELQEPLQ